MGQIISKWIGSGNNTDQVVLQAIASFAPPEQDSPVHILNALCDELLYDVFTRLHYLDLLNVANVCIRFQIQAHAAFSSTYKNLELKHEECDQYKMKSVLSEFGRSIQSLRVAPNIHLFDDGDLFRTILQNCSSSLKVLHLANVTIRVNSLNFRLPFPELEELELNQCKGNYSLAHLIDDCPELIKIVLYFGQMQGLNELINRQFKKLQQLHTTGGIINDAALEHFITSNPGLVELTVESDCRLQTSRAIRLIGQNMLGLQKLNFDLNIQIQNLGLFQSDVQHIGNLRSLKSLKLNFNWLDVGPLVTVLVMNNLPIQEFGMEYAKADDNAINWISRLRQINVLEITWVWGINNGNLFTLVRNLPELQKIRLIPDDFMFKIDGIIQMIHHAKKLSHFYWFSRQELEIDVDSYNEMLEAIKNRPEKIGLRIKHTSHYMYKINVAEKILQENRDILCIEQYEINYSGDSYMNCKMQR